MASKRKKYAIDKEKVAEFLVEDRRRIDGHLKRLDKIFLSAENSKNDKEIEEKYLYLGSRVAKIFEVLQKENEQMIRFLEKFDNEQADLSDEEQLGQMLSEYANIENAEIDVENENKIWKN